MVMPTLWQHINLQFHKIPGSKTVAAFFEICDRVLCNVSPSLETNLDLTLFFLVNRKCKDWMDIVEIVEICSWTKKSWIVNLNHKRNGVQKIKNLVVVGLDNANIVLRTNIIVGMNSWQIRYEKVKDNLWMLIWMQSYVETNKPDALHYTHTSKQLRNLQTANSQLT